MSKLYKNSGVDVVKTDQLIVQALKFIKSSHNKKVLGNKLGFSAEYKINKDITLCSATDGVGTKAILAAELGMYQGIGQDLVGMCSNDLLCNKAKPLFFLDYFACSSVIPKQYTEILKSITKACKKIQCALIGGETAEMPSLYQKNHFDMAGFLVGLKPQQEKFIGKAEARALPVEHVADIIFQAATRPKPRQRYLVVANAWLVKLAAYFPDSLRDRLVMARLKNAKKW